MINYIKLIFSVLLIILTISSCFQDPIDLDLNENNEKLAIEAWLNTLEEDQIVTLSRTANYLGDDPYKMVSNAIITLSNDQGEMFAFTETSPGIYMLEQNWQPRYEAIYTLRIESDGEIYSADHKLRQSPPIEALTYESYFNEEDSLLGYETVFALQETPGLGDAYYVIDYLKNTLVGDTLLNGGYADDEFFDGEYIDDIRVSEDDRLFQPGDTAVVEVYSIGKESARFLLDVELEVFRGGPFDPPPANVRTNFDGDVVGYFIMSGADRKELQIE